MTSRVLLDSCILIDFLRGDKNAISFFEILKETPVVSAFSVAELFAGVRENEKEALSLFFSSIEVLPLSAEIAQKGGEYRQTYGKSHGVGMLDALIGATAKVFQIPLATRNKKHFPFVKNLIVPY